MCIFDCCVWRMLLIAENHIYVYVYTLCLKNWTHKTDWYDFIEINQL